MHIQKMHIFSIFTQNLVRWEQYSHEQSVNISLIIYNP